MKINLFQNSYSANIPLIQGLENFIHDNKAPLEREFPTYKFFYYEKIYLEADLTGILSPKFKEKTGLNGDQFKKIIKDNPGYDCYFINPFESDLYLFFNIWTQAECCHPGIFEISKSLIKKVTGLDITQMPRATHRDLAFCNFWVGSQAFWEKFIPFCEKISKEMLLERDIFFKTTTHYNKSNLPFYPFVIERLFSTFLSFNKDIKVYSIQIDDLNSEALSTERKEFAALSKNIYLCKKELNYNKALEKALLYNFNNLKQLKPLNINQVRDESDECLELLDHILDKNLTTLKLYEFELIKNDFLDFHYSLDEDLLLPNVFYYIYILRPDLQNTFNLSTKDGKKSFYSWCKNHGTTEVLTKIITIKRSTNTSTISPTKKNGFNLIGFDKYSLGLGEDLRNFKNLLSSMNIPHSTVSLKYESQNLLNTDTEKYFVFTHNIFFIPLPDIKRFFQESSFSLDKSFYNIGYCPWEFNKWSNRYQHHLHHIDEIWGISDFTLNAYQNQKNIKLTKINSLFDFEKMTLKNQKEASDNIFRFLYIFDSNSNIHRKNPQALISAFKKAFPFKKYKNIHLVLKTIRLEKNPDSKEILETLIEADPRIILLNVDYSQEELIKLQKKCNVYVSPHRCEGLGRTLIEAMYLEKPVIATNYSGNLDFCIEGNFLPIDYELTKVDHQYSFTDDSFEWASVKEKSLMDCLTTAFESYDELLTQTSYIKDFITNKYSIKSNTERYRTIFNDLGFKI